MSDSFVTPWTVAPQAPLSMKFFRQEYWSGLPFPSPGDLPDPGTEPMAAASPALQTDSQRACTPLIFPSQQQNTVGLSDC